MAIRHLNYTGRKRLLQTDARFTIYESGEGIPKFNAELDLGDYGLPDEAPVVVEAHRQTNYMRFPFGTVAAVLAPENRELVEFDSAEGILFRVKVTSPSEPLGLLLAERDRIQPRRPDEQEDNRISLLPVKPDQDLGAQVFQVDFNDGPILRINASVGDWRAVARDPVFVSLVYPQALREVLTRIALIDGLPDAEDPDDWRSQWLRFAGTLPGMSTVPSEHSEGVLDNWIDEAVASFSRQSDIIDRFGQYWSGEGAS
jgi:hypothetical protein